MKKYLPIKFYQKREKQDDRLTNAGGSGDDPKWVLTGEELLQHSNILVDEMHSISQFVLKKLDRFDFIPTIMSVELNEKAIAKSHRSSLKDIFNQKQEQNIIGFNNDSELLIRINSIEDINQIKKKLSNTQKYAKGISSIEEIEAYTPSSFEFTEDTGQKILKASLFNYFDYSLNQSVKTTFERYCTEIGTICREVFYTNDLIVFRLENVDSIGKFSQIMTFPSLEFITPMPRFKIGVQAMEEEASIEIEEPDAGKAYPIVGILDSGIANIPHLNPWIEDSITNYPEELLSKEHGTFVGGIVAYGDQLEGREITGVKHCKLFDAAVLPNTTKESITEDELLENIHAAIKSNPKVKVWNMSLGYEDLEIDSDNFSQFAMALDDLQQRFNIIICKAAGNCNNFLTGKPVGRITIPSESLLSIVVGSVSDNGEPSAFSRIGTGSAHINKPDLVSYGGNFIRHGKSFKQLGVKSFGVNGAVTEQSGTSFSTPRVSTLLAGLDSEIAEEFDPLLLKALAIHTAKYPEQIKLDQNERIAMMGYGIPDNINNIIYNSDHEITLIQSDRLVKGTYLEILEFPYPESLVDKRGHYIGDITITLATSPVLFSGNGAEYCQSNIDVIFGTFDEIKENEITSLRRNEYGPDSLANILLPEKYSKRFIKADFENPFTRERTLLRYGKKYQPIKKWHINLSEFTPANKEKHLAAPKKWGLRLTGLYRDFAETRAGLDGEQLYQDFCLIITIKDPSNKHLIYNEVTQLLDLRNFIHNDIQLRENIQTQVRV